MKTQSKQRRKPSRPTRRDDAQAYRVWAMADNDFEGWVCGAQFRYLMEALDYMAYLWDRGTVYVYQSPTGCETVNPATDRRPVFKPEPAPQRCAVLVYQCGIANVFETLADGSRVRFLQADFDSCYWMARGLKTAGWVVHTMQCNRAGDIIGEAWSADLDAAPFSDRLRVV